MAESALAPVEEEVPGLVGDAWDMNLPLHTRLFLAVGEIGRLEKRDTAKVETKSGGQYTYDFISHDDVTLAVKQACQKHGILVWPTVTSHSKDGNRTELNVRVVFINVDNPDEAISTEAVGYGVDNTDKGPGKAYSYAVKNALLKAFQLNSADDIELDNIPHESEHVRGRDLAEAKARSNNTLEAWAYNYRKGINDATTLKELKDLQKANKDVLLDDDTPKITRDYFIELFESKKAKLEDKVEAE